MKNIIRVVLLLVMAAIGVLRAYAQPCSAKFSKQTKDYIVSFHNSSFASGKISYYWNFGDGLYSNLKNPIHAYNQIGRYRVALYITDGTCSDLYIDSVDITIQSPGCRAAFTFDLTSDTVRFYNISTGIDSNTKYIWDFGDGTFSSLQDPEHQYHKGGNKYVRLKIENPFCLDSIEIQLYIKPVKTCNAEFSYITHADTVFFSESSINAQALHYWTFGDNSTSTEISPYHVYAKNGNYTVCLQVNDTNTGYRESWCDTILLNTIPCAKADFNYTFNNTKVQFNNLSSSNITNCYWVFGDGSYSIDKNPNHRYQVAGDYKVKLFVTDSIFLCSDSMVKIIQIPSGRELYTIKGKVLYKNKPADRALVLLINADSLASTVFQIDTVQVFPADSGQYIFANVKKGYYTIKAIPEADSKLYTKYIPAYFTGEFLWEKITPLYINFDFDEANIYLKRIPFTQASGGIAGSVESADSSGSSKKTHLGHRSLIVFNQDQIPVGTALSDSLGKFKISLMGEGIYQIYMDVPGKKNSPLQFEITQSKLYFERCLFLESLVKTYPDISYANGIFQPLKSGMFSIFPNPSADNITLSSTELIQSINVYNSSGSQVIYKDGLYSENIYLDIQMLPAGLYIININTNSGQQRFLKFIKE